MNDPDYHPLPADKTDVLTAWLDASGDPGGAPPETIEAVEDVLLERRRQILEKDCTPEMDNEHSGAIDRIVDLHLGMALGSREALVRAGALVLAEIERIDRGTKGSPDASPAQDGGTHDA